jgi:putative membrane protein
VSEAAASPAANAARRLHPSSLLLCLIEDLRKWILPLGVVLFLGSGQSWELWLMVWIAPSMAYETLRLLTMRYRIAGGELIVRSGILEKSERHIPFDRIQNIDLVQGPLQRMLGVAEVRVETASGNEAEAVLRFLALKDVEAMRERVFADRRASGVSSTSVEGGEVAGLRAPADVGPVHTILRLGAGDLVRLGLTVNRGIAVILAGLGLVWEFDLRDRLWNDSIESWIDGLDSSGLTLFGIATVLGVLALTLLLSIIATFIRLYGFQLERQGKEFRLQCGLLTRHSATIPRERIQLLSIHEGPLQRLMGCVSIRVETAGGSEGEVASVARKWFVPILHMSRLSAVLREIVP